jgi:hypothetical protein
MMVPFCLVDDLGGLDEVQSVFDDSGRLHPRRLSCPLRVESSEVEG